MSATDGAANQAVIDDELIRKCIYIPDEENSILKKDGVDNKDSKKESIEFHEIKCLIFSFKNIKKIDNLTGLENLRKLQLDNNVIEKIENLGSLTNLTWLDLSFNNIEKIEGLDELINLTDLSLFSNKIQVLEGLDNLTNLTVLSIGNNLIKPVDETVKYLRRFKNLRCLNLAGNKLCDDPEYKVHVLAYIRNLTYLDYRLVDEAAVTTARETFQSELQELEEKEHSQENELEANRLREEHRATIAAANLAGVDTLFTDMTRENNELNKLRSLNVLADPFEEYRDKFKIIIEEYMSLIFSQREKMKEEKDLFEGVIEQLRKKSETGSVDLITKFNGEKKRCWTEVQNHAEDIVDPADTLGHLKELNDELRDALMEIETEQIEHFDNLIREFEKNYQDLFQVVIEATQANFGRLRDLQNQFHDRISELAEHAMIQYAEVVEKEAAAASALSTQDDDEDKMDDMDSEFNDDARALLQDKDTLLNALAGAHDMNTGRINDKEDEICRRERDNLDNMIQKWKQLEIKRNRQRVSDIWWFCEKNRVEIAKFEEEGIDDS